jgi:hypothetical protein
MTKVGGEENVDRRNEAEAVNSDDESVADESDDEQEAVHMKWLQQSFVKPLRALQELSSFPNLVILVTVAVTSCSAERVMSRVKIVKNRLRSTMNDEWFSALTILASERDITDSLPTNQIIDTFALCSTKLQNILGVHADSEKT